MACFSPGALETDCCQLCQKKGSAKRTFEVEKEHLFRQGQRVFGALRALKGAAFRLDSPGQPLNPKRPMDLAEGTWGVRFPAVSDEDEESGYFDFLPRIVVELLRQHKASSLDTARSQLVSPASGVPFFLNNKQQDDAIER